MTEITDPDSLYDFIGFVVVCAPNNWPYRDYLPPEGQMTLDRAFAELRGSLEILDPEVVSESKRPALVRLLDESLAAYLRNDDFGGAHLLQDFQDLIFRADG